ncbi:transporter substrate-binding domain-containing protein [Rhodococcus pyridinivorans]|uniref:ABC transporter substrate-binding protein n=1 Tax=Rhodococcus pyridinivorans SB3094 TaxID=1435356 RepID=V9XI73_9NOCA|nr:MULTISPECIES: glutamate ABC transporter substrate-binding protein [Rhodococcus]AHD21012.1 ABC transporter substrate-binding protein [Rhodococcus pyridinivorans SB3094]AHD21740.1 ABC transporter substrate-binding protein [Rhodococcus pyridinivorans SB3094]MCT7292666.1 transporter substrate-binding domain-containing protein [Rhodococcus sp. PAE-6]USI89480.1 transporter substrate-binding domain-containing protein [Rhodococcus pyridinivorans]
MRERVLVAGLCVVAALAGGCATDPPPRAPGLQGTTTSLPLPENARMLESSVATPPAPDCGDPTASLPPDPNATGPAIDRIRTRGRLIVGLDTGSNLMSYRDTATGRITGFDVDIAREIARDLLGDPDLVDYRILSSAEREKALQDSTVDIVAKTMSITCARREKVDFSTEYFRAQQRVLVVRGSDIRSAADLAGRRVCIVEGTTSLLRMREVQPSASILTVPSWADCLVVLQQQQVDAVSTDDTILAGLASQDPYLELVGPSLGSEPYGIGIRLGSDELVRFVNATLERIRSDGTWTALYDKYLRVLGPTPSPPTPNYRK